MSEALMKALSDFIIAVVDNRNVAHNAGGAVVNPVNVGSVLGVAPTPALTTAAPAPAADPFGLSTGTTAGTVAPAIEVTPAMVQEVVMKLIHNEAAKAKLSAAMQNLGITELPATPPEKLGAVYAAFKAVEAEFAGAASAPAAGGMTII